MLSCSVRNARMPVGAGSVGAGDAAKFTSGSAGVAAGMVVRLGVTERIFATNANELESGDQRMVSGNWTAIVSEVNFFRTLPSGVYISSRCSDGISVI